jgi:hypothetical protein
MAEDGRMTDKFERIYKEGAMAKMKHFLRD